MPLELRPIRLEDEDQVRAAHELMAREHFVFAVGLVPGEPFADYVRRLERYQRGLDLPEGWVPCTVLVGEVDGSIVGRLCFRHELNDFLRRIGGHIGYGVLPEQRRRGYATAMLQRGLELARGRGIDRALVTCDESNPTSRRVIERCGGALEGVYDDHESGERVLQFWVQL